jgi:hypothetical protein
VARCDGWGIKTGRLIKFGVENSHKDQYQHADNGKGTEGDIADNPGVAAHRHVDIGHEKTETTGDEKNQPDNHEEEKHLITLTKIITCIAAKLYPVSG